jgi:hypothetical protein
MIERDIQQDKTVRRHLDRADGRDPHDVTRRADIGRSYNVSGATISRLP